MSYAVGDWVLLRLRQRPVVSLSLSPKGKLQPCFFGPYRITELINEVAVRLDLPPRAKLHDVFHVGLLKKWAGDPPVMRPPGCWLSSMVRSFRARTRGVHTIGSRCPAGAHSLEGEPAASATCEDLEAFSAKYPSF